MAIPGVPWDQNCCHSESSDAPPFAALRVAGFFPAGTSAADDAEPAGLVQGRFELLRSAGFSLGFGAADAGLGLAAAGARTNSPTSYRAIRSFSALACSTIDWLAAA